MDPLNDGGPVSFHSQRQISSSDDAGEKSLIETDEDSNPGPVVDGFKPVMMRRVPVDGISLSLDQPGDVPRGDAGIRQKKAADEVLGVMLPDRLNATAQESGMYVERGRGKDFSNL